MKIKLFVDEGQKSIQARELLYGLQGQHDSEVQVDVFPASLEMSGEPVAHYGGSPYYGIGEITELRDDLLQRANN